MNSIPQGSDPLLSRADWRILQQEVVAIRRWFLSWVPSFQRIRFRRGIHRPWRLESSRWSCCWSYRGNAAKPATCQATKGISTADGAPMPTYTGLCKRRDDSRPCRCGAGPRSTNAYLHCVWKCWGVFNCVVQTCIYWWGFVAVTNHWIEYSAHHWNSDQRVSIIPFAPIGYFLNLPWLFIP